MAPPPCRLVASFDGIRFTGYHIPSYVPFEITIQTYNMVILGTIIDEGTLVSIMSSTTWKALGSSQLVPVTQNLLAFNRGTSQPLGILPKFPFTLGGEIVYIDMMVVQGPSDFNLILGRDYAYAMGALVSSLFLVICFPHKGQIVTIDKISFFGPDVVAGPPSSLLDLYR